jgi:bla regulator protein blaR1
LQERRNQCGMFTGRGVIVSGSVTLAQLARSMGGLAGGEIEDRTGLKGSYSVELTYSLQRSGGPALNPNATVSDAPEFFTAVQEQLGLKLQREKRMMPVFVIDHVERPSAN